MKKGIVFLIVFLMVISFPICGYAKGKEKIYLDSSWKYADHARITSGYETNEKTARICTGICDDRHDLSAVSGICSSKETRPECKNNDTSGGTEKDPESKECREKG